MSTFKVDVDNLNINLMLTCEEYKYLPCLSSMKGLWSSSMPPYGRSLENSTFSCLWDPPGYLPLGFNRSRDFNLFSANQNENLNCPQAYQAASSLFV